MQVPFKSVLAQSFAKHYCSSIKIYLRKLKV